MAERSSPVIGVDTDVVVREVARPHSEREASPRPSTTRTVISALLHHPLAVGFAGSVGRGRRAGDQDIVQIQIELGRRRDPLCRHCRSRQVCGRGSGRRRRTRSSPAANARWHSATWRHSPSSRPPSTRMVMNLVAPSPSRTIACARSRRDVRRARREARRTRCSVASTIRGASRAAGRDQRRRSRWSTCRHRP